mgnify:FL=1
MEEKKLDLKTFLYKALSDSAFLKAAGMKPGDGPAFMKATAS